MTNSETKLSIAEINRYLSIADSIKDSYHFYDMHVHPFEIVFTKSNYHKNQNISDLYSTGSSTFSPPQISEIILEKGEEKTSALAMTLSSAIFKLKFSSMYAHTGPEVFNSQMNLSKIDRILLLPVAPLQGNVDPQMTDIKIFFGNDNRFFTGWSVSNDLTNDKIYNKACEENKKNKIYAIKQNLSQTEINIAVPEGKERLEAILDTCTRLNLPFILHSGRSPLARNEDVGRFSMIDVLENFDWNSFHCPIIFAHSAAYGYSAEEINKRIISRLKKMISKHQNMFIDISGVDVLGLPYILNAIPTERILFGSDALYESQWQRLVKFLYALENSKIKFDESLLKIMVHNPEFILFGSSASAN